MCILYIFYLRLFVSYDGIFTDKNNVLNKWQYLILLQDYLDVIEKLPDNDDASFFGLPANIERTAQRVNSQRVTSQLKTLMRSVEAGAKFDR